MIDGWDEDALARLVEDHFTPSQHILTPERLFGREIVLRDIGRTLRSRGRQILLYGDRGVGKSSVALTSAALCNSSRHKPIYTVCGEDDTFSSVIQSVGQQVNQPEKLFETGSAPPNISGGAFGWSGSYTGRGDKRVTIPAPQTINDALSIIRYVAERREGNVVIVIDELERLKTEKERQRFSEFVKNLPSVDDRVKLILCGISSTVEELIGPHPSAGRILEAIELKRILPEPLWEIVNAVAKATAIQIDREILIRISQLSAGFPHYVHLIGECIFWRLHDSARIEQTVDIYSFNHAVNDALQKVEAQLRYQYERATLKSKNTIDYQEALWALADKNSDKRQLGEIYDASYRPLMLQRRGRKALERDVFNQRLLTLRGESYGKVVRGFGSGWFGFRENIIRGYVRLLAQREGIQLGSHS